jgi:hypothetical protein
MATGIIFVAIYIGPGLPLFSFLNAVHIFMSLQGAAVEL